MTPTIDYVDTPGIRTRVQTVFADASLFRPSHRQDLGEADAVCVDLDAISDLDCAAGWVAKSLSLGKQVFVVGSRETLLRSEKAIQGDVTLLERTGPLANQCGENLADAISRQYEAMYEPFQDVPSGFIPGSEETALNIATDEAINPPTVIDPQYFKPVLTDEQRKQLVAFLRRPEQENGEDDSAESGSSFTAH